MPDTGTPRSPRGRSNRIAVCALAVATAAVLCSLGGGRHGRAVEIDGVDLAYRPSTRPTIEAAFARESYRSGAVARLVIFSKRAARGASMQIFRAGTERGGIR